MTEPTKPSCPMCKKEMPPGEEPPTPTTSRGYPIGGLPPEPVVSWMAVEEQVVTDPNRVVWSDRCGLFEVEQKGARIKRLRQRVERAERYKAELAELEGTAPKKSAGPNPMISLQSWLHAPIASKRSV